MLSIDSHPLPAARHAALIGAAIGIGAGDSRTALGPQQLLRAGVVEDLLAAGASAHWVKTLLPMLSSPRQDLYDRVAEFGTRLAQAVAGSLVRRQLPIVLGGDHSCAIGTWSGVAKGIASLGDSPEFGLIWVDAHKDAHTPDTTPSGNIHGMPLAALLGRGDARLTEIGGPAPKVKPEHVVLVGARSYESGEADLLRELGVQVYYMHDIARDGMDVVMRRAILQASRARHGFGVTFDLDAIDPRDAPGIGSPEADGIRGDDAVLAMQQLAARTDLLAMEVVEYNPTLDEDGRTARLTRALLRAALLGS
jgi:arginase